jgi:hypothetical protein
MKVRLSDAFHRGGLCAALAVAVLAAPGHTMASDPVAQLEPRDASMVESAELAAARALPRPVDLNSDLEMLQLASKGLVGESPAVIPAAAFRSSGSDADGYFMSANLGYVRGTADGDGCIQAPVSLPQGAVVHAFWASVLDEDDTADALITLDRISNLEYQHGDEMAYVETSGSGASIQNLSDFSISHQDVKLPDYGYFVKTCLPSTDVKLYGVRVYYADIHLFSDGFELGDLSAWSAASGLKRTPARTRQPAPPPIATFPSAEQRAMYSKQLKAYGSPLTIAPAEFNSTGSQPGAIRILASSGFLYGDDTNSALMVAPVYLPHGATIESFWARVRDDDESCPASDIQLKLWRVNKNTGETDEMSRLETSGSGSAPQWLLDVDVVYPEISYPDYSYYVELKMCAQEHRLHAVEIFYSTN